MQREGSELFRKGVKDATSDPSVSGDDRDAGCGKRGGPGGDQDRHRRPRHFNRADNLLGKGGNDTLFGLGGTDNLLGGTGKDLIFGGYRDSTGRGDDILVGGSGNDAVFGSQGSNNILGGEGNDYLVDGNEPNPNKDTIYGGDGTDVIFAWNRPAGTDLVVCGPGYDRVAADRSDDVARDCEKVSIYHRSFPDAFFESIPESFWEGLP